MKPAPVVTVYDGRQNPLTDDAVEWSGSLAAFFRENRDGIQAEERRAMLRDFRQFNQAFTGGGAAPFFYLVLEG